MKYEYFEVEKLPVVVIDNFYNEQEVKLIMQEINFLHSLENKFKSAEELDSSFDIIDKENVYRKSGTGLVLNAVYNDMNISNILTLNRKIFSSEVMSKLISMHSFFKYVEASSLDMTKLNYYGDTQEYKFHKDRFVVSSANWFYNKPKKFEGGDFVFKDNIRVECEFNRYVLFPSILEHGVEKTKLAEPDTYNTKNGRYSINHFIVVK